MAKDKQELPKWFEGVLYTCGDVVTNPFTGASCVLTPAELSMYDFIMGCALTNRLPKEMVKGLTWFRRANAEAYMILLD